MFGGKSTATAASLLRWNRAAGIFLVLQGIAILLFSASVGRPLYASFLTADTLQTQLTQHAVTAPAVHQLAMINITYLVAAWLLAAGAVRLLAATAGRARYEAGLKKGVSVFRWTEAGIVAALLLMTIGLLAGVADAAALLAIMLLSAAAATAGFVCEYAGTAGKRARRIQQTAGWLAALLGLAPWSIVALYAFGAAVFGSGPVLPAYWFWLAGITLILTGVWGGNVYLGQAQRGAWASYLHNERAGMLAGSILKTVAAWLIFAALLHP